MSKELIDIEELRQDNLNFNKGTYEGEVLIKKSLERFKAGRSVLIDKDNNIIAGNKTVQAAATMGMKVRVIETTGDELVAVKRTDIDINSKEGREMALLDNLTTQVNLNWDDVELQNMADEYDIEMNDWDMALPDIADPDEQPTTEAKDVKELKLVFTPEQYQFVLAELRKYGDDFTHSLLQILNIHE